MSRRGGKASAKRASKSAAPPRAQRKKIFRRSKKPFRFLDLPLEIQRMVYDLCLTSSEDIVIKIDNSDGGNGFDEVPRGMSAEYDQLVDLTSNHSNIGYMTRDKRITHHFFNTNLLRASKRVYAETAPVLYSRNNFCFEGEDGLDAFTFFHQRLTDISLHSLQSLNLKIPQVRRLCSDEGDCEVIIDDFETWLIETLKGFKTLRNLYLHLDQDLIAGDVALLSLYGGTSAANITLRVSPMGNCNDIMRPYRSISIHEAVVAQISRLGWDMVGHFEKVDAQHIFWDQQEWIALLKAQDRKALSRGIRKQSVFVTPKAPEITRGVAQK